MTTEILLDCGHAPSPHSDFTTGYGVDAQNKRYCYDCCAERERQAMREHGRASLYLTKNEAGCYQVTGWPGTPSFQVLSFRTYKAAAFGGYIPAINAWFVGPDGHVWIARQKGDMDLCRCTRTKQRYQPMSFYGR